MTTFLNSLSNAAVSSVVSLVHLVLSLVCLNLFHSLPARGQAPASSAATQLLQLDQTTRDQCLAVLRAGLTHDDFWPAMHAAEGLTLGGYSAEVVPVLLARLPQVTDDQQRCGVARELVRAGRVEYQQVMLDILAGSDPYGHTHAAESLYKVVRIGDGAALRHHFSTTTDLRLKLMAAGALARCGSPAAMAYLRQMVHHDDPQLAMIAAWILGVIGDDTDLPALRDQLARCPDPLSRAYVENALAVLGDPEGVAALQHNLHSDQTAVRTYAANFAGDTRQPQLADDLIGLLDDANPDTAIRAAQSLLFLAQPQLHDANEDISTLVYPWTPDQTRWTEGSIVELDDGSLLFAISAFQKQSSDYAEARIVGCRSTDGGRSWSPPVVLQSNSGTLNVMSVTLRRIGPEQRLGFFYLQKDGHDQLNLLLRFLTDDLRSIDPVISVTQSPGYHVCNNDRVTILRSGRLLAPIATTPHSSSHNRYTSHCMISDDHGQTWRQGQGSVDAPKRGAMEPEVIELSDGRVMMLMRTQLGFIGKSLSRDGGETWTPMEPLANLQSPEAPCTIRRIPATGDLLLVWNDTYDPEAGHGGRRTPLSMAISRDDGVTWKALPALESDPARTFSYTSMMFVQDRVVMSYWDSPSGTQYSNRFRSIPVAQLYQGPLSPETP